MGITQGSLMSFMLKTVDTLGKNKISRTEISSLLFDLCVFFEFSCGFIYEFENNEAYVLCERCQTEQFRLTETITPTEFLPVLKALAKDKEYVYFSDMSDEECSKTGINEVFGMCTAIFVPHTDGDGKVIAIVGLGNPNSTGRIDSQEESALGVILNLIARHVAVRVFSKQTAYSLKTLHDIMDNTGIDIYVNDFNTHEMLYANKSMAAPYGGIKTFNGRKCWEILYEDKSDECDFCPQKKLIDERGEPTKIYSWDYQRPFDGAWFRMLSAAFKWVDGRLAHVVSSVDITENKRNESLIKKMANYDMLTGLANRRKLVKDCDALIANINNNGGNAFLLFLDLDGFKQINDTFGHKAGDDLLVMAGRYFEELLVKKGTAYRHGGDEFIILLPNIIKDEVRVVLHDILNRFAHPFSLDAGKVSCKISIGVAQYPQDGKDAEQLIHIADTTMYEVKRNGKGAACFAIDGEFVV